MRKAFTLIELLVVIGIIALLLAISVPALRYARDQGGETVCRSNLRQLAIILRTYTSEHDNLFPDARYIYHSPESFDRRNWPEYLKCCRWHDERMGFDSPLLRDHPELRGSLWPYLGDKEILRCQVGRRANDLRGCYNNCWCCVHLPGSRVATQYTYAMNSHLGSDITTGMGNPGGKLDSRTRREVPVRRESQVTRSPSNVFLFGEKNSWAVNMEGRQPIGVDPSLQAQYKLRTRKAIESEIAQV